MAKSECICKNYSCESVTKKTDNGVYEVDTNKRFRFVKDEKGSICDGGIVPNGIENCEIKNLPDTFTPRNHANPSPDNQAIKSKSKKNKNKK